MMNEPTLRAQAALAELQAINDWLTNRCSEHAQEIAVKEFHIQELAKEIVALKGASNGSHS